MNASPAREALVTAAVVTTLVTLASRFVPLHSVATAIGTIFFGATWLMVFRRDDDAVVHAGLAFSGLVLPARLEPSRITEDLAAALVWALLLALAFFGPFYIGFRLYARWVWHVHPAAWPTVHSWGALNEAVGQFALVALPEEAFYRGYLQTRLDDAWPARSRVLGAPVGLSILVTSAIFALGHVLTIHEAGRLAVFFPSLLFGWLRARTDGVGASIAFHAACNLFSATLLQAYGPH